MPEEPFGTVWHFHRVPTPFGLPECSGGPRCHHLVVLHTRSYAWVFMREEAEAEAARLAEYGDSLIIPITPDMVSEEAVVVQIIHTYYANRTQNSPVTYLLCRVRDVVSARE